MTAQYVLTIGRDALALLLMVSMPVLGAVLVFAIAGPWMLTTLVDYLRRTLESIPSVVG